MRKILLLLFVPLLLNSCGTENEEITKDEVFNQIQADMMHMKNQLDETKRMINDSQREVFNIILSNKAKGAEAPLVIDQVIQSGEFSFMLTSSIIEGNARVMGMLSEGKSPAEVQSIWESEKNQIERFIQDFQEQFNARRGDIQKILEGGAPGGSEMPQSPPTPKKPS